MKRIFFLALAAVALGACDSEPKFKVEGEVSGAEGKTLYLEAAAIEGIQPLDSLRLSAEGTFSFAGRRPQSPEFYRLRIENKVINFSVDSTETVTIHAPYVNFATAYSVEGSAESEKIRLLTLKLVELQDRVNALSNDLQANRLGATAFEDSLRQAVKRYKDRVKIDYIFAAPNTAAAYFALFQRLNGYLLFDPLNNRDDVRCFGAVATSMENFYPEATRTKNLKNITLKGMKNTRPQEQKVLEVPAEAITETGVIDINLRDLKGASQQLTALKGKVVILDFTVYQTAVSATHNYLLRELYDKYADRGLQIYQVSLDADEHYWKTVADNMPWICVRDANGIYSNYAAAYNVQAVPAFFLINRNNELVDRSDNVKDIEAAVKALL